MDGISKKVVSNVIFLTGDIHGTLDIDKLSEKNWRSQSKLTRDDYLIILGDFGLYWQKNENYEYLINFYKSRPYTVLWLDGNHENFSWIKKIPMVKFCGGNVQIDDNIIHLMRGEVYNIDNKTFFVMGGAKSTDKAYRIENISWWAEEEPNLKEKNNAIRNLEKTNYKVDYILTHACPAQISKLMFGFNGNSDTERFLDLINSNCIGNFKQWYFGHYHQDDSFHYYTCLYDNVVKLK